jgi:hypothetical protein
LQIPTEVDELKYELSSAVVKVISTWYESKIAKRQPPRTTEKTIISYLRWSLTTMGLGDVVLEKIASITGGEEARESMVRCFCFSTTHCLFGLQYPAVYFQAWLGLGCVRGIMK